MYANKTVMKMIGLVPWQRIARLGHKATLLDALSRQSHHTQKWHYGWLIMPLLARNHVLCDHFGQFFFSFFHFGGIFLAGTATLILEEVQRRAFCHVYKPLLHVPTVSNWFTWLCVFFLGIAVNCLGHAHPELVQTLSEQSAKLMHISNLYVISHIFVLHVPLSTEWRNHDYPNLNPPNKRISTTRYYSEPQGRLASQLVDRLGPGKVFFCNSGEYNFTQHTFCGPLDHFRHRCKHQPYRKQEPKPMKGCTSCHGSSATPRM